MAAKDVRFSTDARTRMLRGVDILAAAIEGIVKVPGGLRVDLKRSDDGTPVSLEVDEVIAANPDKVEQAKTNPKAVGWFVGQVMKSSGGKASPQAVNEILKSKLGL